MAVVYNYNAGPTYTKIASQTLGSATASITFSNIPQNYTDLIIVFTGKSTNTGSATNGFRCRVNGDTGSNYSGTPIKGDGSTASGTRYTSTAFFEPGDIAQTSSTSLSTIIINFMNYSNTTTYKTFISRGNTASSIVEAYATLWRSTSAINSVTLSRDFGTNNLASGCIATLYGITAALKPKATGGNTVITDGTYWYHTFTSSGVFTPTQSINADYLVVAGGGGGGAESGGGGGAGGLRSTVTATGGGGSLETPLTLSLNTSYTVTVGAGGAGSARSSISNGYNGNASEFSTIVSKKGGGGGSNTVNSAGDYGSAGGAGASTGAGTVVANGTATANQGYAGGNGQGTGSFPNRSGGGGGGAGSAGSNATATVGGNGGTAVTVAISGSSVAYAGGGGGGGSTNASGGGGGAGTGGAGAQAGTNANANTGSGGGGGGYQDPQGAGGNGGSGIVIVRYSA